MNQSPNKAPNIGFKCICMGTGYVLARLKAAPDGAPYAFRCNCDTGRARFTTGIPSWDYRRLKEYTVIDGVLYRDLHEQEKLLAKEEAKATPEPALPQAPSVEALVW